MKIKSKTICFAIFFLCCVFLYKCFGFFIRTSFSSSFIVKDGDGLSRISTNLKTIGLISNNITFKVYSKIWMLFNKCDIVQKGDYYFEKGENFDTILYKLCNGKTEMKSLTIPEGLETREVLELLNNSEYLSGDNVNEHEEGIIFPDTYNFSNQITKKELFEKMKQQLNWYVNQLWDERIRNDFIRTKKELIILASIVEKEAKTDEERPIIASVYLNRLAKGMRLEACPTAFYEITKGKYKLKRPLTIKDTKIKGNYNTYQKKGLPAGPICNPGVNSILAVLYPAKTEYLYFAAKSDLSGNVFAKTYEEHLKNIKLIKEEKSAKQ